MKWFRKSRQNGALTPPATDNSHNLYYREPKTPSPVTFTLEGGFPRNPERIEFVLSRLRQAWELDPDQRLGQLILGLAEAWEDAGTRVYNVEDAVLYDRLGKRLGLQGAGSEGNASDGGTD